MSLDKNSLLLLFQKPLEPVFTYRGKGKIKIEVPSEYYTERYKSLASKIVDTRFSDDVEQTITIESVNLPDLSFADSLGKKSGFSLFNDKHKDIAAQLTKIFMVTKQNCKYFI